MEVGLGGRLDATNVVDPTVSVITSIALEHTRILGDTEEAIAIEKAGIIKPGRPVLTGLTPADPAYRVVAERAATLGCPLQGPGSGLDVTDIREVEEADGSWVLRWSGRVGARSLSDMTIPEGPRHQVWNALLAAAAAQEVLKSLGRSLDPDATRRALSGPSLPGRCTWIAGNPPLLIDGAHTAGSVAALVPVVLRRAKGRPVHLLCGLTRDRDPAAVLSPLWDVVASVTATRLPSPRSHPPEALVEAVPRSLPTEGVPDTAVALSRVLARALSTGGIVLVTGSLYLAGDVLGTLESQAGSKGPLRSPHDPRP
jgi:dihydrofolate synthase/folylpolyglutamate synthase